MDALVDAFNSLSDWITSVVFFSVTIGGATLPLVVVWLVVAGTFFTFWLGFMNLRGMRLAIDLVRGRYSNPNDAGEVTHFQALATAVSGTVGLGNIAGVAVAISIGGPGATFWMIIAGLVGMSTKMAECMLGVKFRRQYADGTVSGGPMYYLTDGMKTIGLGGPAQERWVHRSRNCPYCAVEGQDGPKPTPRFITEMGAPVQRSGSACTQRSFSRS